MKIWKLPFLTFFLILALFNSFQVASAQSEKGKCEPAYEVQSGTSEIAGEPEVLERAARKSWTSACADWKKEMKDLNKDEKVMILDCGSPNCLPEKGQFVCKSQGTYKIKVRLSEQ